MQSLSLHNDGVRRFQPCGDLAPPPRARAPALGLVGREGEGGELAVPPEG